MQAESHSNSRRINSGCAKQEFSTALLDVLLPYSLASVSLSASSLALRPCKYLEASISSARSCFCGEGSGLDNLAFQGCNASPAASGEARSAVSRLPGLPARPCNQRDHPAADHACDLNDLRVDTLQEKLSSSSHCGLG